MPESGVNHCSCPSLLLLTVLTGVDVPVCCLKAVGCQIDEYVVSRLLQQLLFAVAGAALWWQYSATAAVAA